MNFVRPRIVATVILGFVLSAQVSAADLRIALVTDTAGKNDHSFNESAYNGLLKAQKELGIKGKVIEPPDEDAFEPILRSLAEKNFDLIISVGFNQLDAIKSVARRFPDKKFVLIDADPQLPNVRALEFEEQEGSYLVGYLAALHSTTGTLGFIGGMDIPMIRRFELGYESGAKKANPKIKVLANYVGVTVAAWNDPAKAKELALSQISRGADDIFAPAGNSSLGVFDAVVAQKKLAIGVDSNQDGIRPGRILTSMVKSVDVGVFDSIRSLKEGHFTTGVIRYGLKSNGVQYSLDQFNKPMLKQSEIDQVEKIKAAIIAGRLVVPDYYTANVKK